MERPLAQILVLVVNSQTRTTKDESGKHFMLTLIGCEGGVSKSRGISNFRSKESRLTFPQTEVEEVTHFWSSEAGCGTGQSLYSV